MPTPPLQTSSVARGTGVMLRVDPAERMEAAAKAQQRQQEELALINAECGGDFSRLGAGQKAGLALELTPSS